MKTLIFKSKKNIFEVIESNGHLTVNKAPGVQLENQNSLITANGGKESFLAKCEYSEKSYEQLYNERLSQIKKSRAINDKANNVRLENLWEVAPMEKYAKGLYDLFEEIIKLEKDGWKVVDFFFLSENPLSNALRKKIGSYTATPYDTGEVIIKSNGVSYSNHRHHSRLSISDLLNQK